MDLDVDLGNLDDEVDETSTQPTETDPDAFFAKNAFRMVYQTNNFFLPQIKDLIDRGEVLNIRPEYQRRLRWSVVQKSKLIESLLLNIPVPPIFFYESAAARYEVMDGQQRLNAVKEFLAGDFVLTGLPVLKPLNGLRYSNCPPRIKRALDRATLSAIVLLLESEAERSNRSITIKDIRRFIFDRLNTGGTKLNPQEIRNALNPGEFNKLIIDLTRFRLFTSIFEIPPYVETDPNEYYENPARQRNKLYSSMGDCQLVLRYFALKDNDNIRGSVKSMLDRAMESNCTEKEAQLLRSEYEERLSFLHDLFSARPFRLPPSEKGSERISAAIYDASMVAANELWEFRSGIFDDKENVIARMNSALNTQTISAVLTGQANTAQGVKDRITTIKEILKPV
jgi:hypothetical protein